ncbi:unnamed protein product, partial [Phaeothamnion confervicola]
MSSAGTPLKLRFLFANHDGIVTELTTDQSTEVRLLKLQLIKAWPSDIPPVDDPGQIRLICMGNGILADAKSLAECRVPAFDTHPTPINVSVRPKDMQAASTGTERRAV